MKQFRNRWIAVHDDANVVADANTLDHLLVVLEAQPATQASIQRVPAADERLFVGLR